MRVGIAEKVFKVRGQRSRSQRGEKHISAEGYRSTYSHPSIVHAEEAYRLTVLHRGRLIKTTCRDYGYFQGTAELDEGI